jgi:hypothetical protein
VGYSQYSEHRRPTAVPKVDRVNREDATGKDELTVQKNFERAQQQVAKPNPKRPFADLIKKPAAKK